MKFLIEAGSAIETLTPAELRSEIAKAQAVWEARAIGVKWTEQGPLPVQPAGPSQQVNGPATGFAWKLRVASVNLAAAGTLAVFKGESPAGRPIANPVASTAFAFGGVTYNIASLFFPDDIVIQSGQQILLAATQNISTYYYGAVQFPAQKAGEILS